MPRGTPEDLLNALNMRIDELSDSAIESTVTIEADGRTGWTTEEVLDFFDKQLHWDIADRRVQNYADAVAEYLDMGYDAWRQAGYDEQPYTLEQWYEDTKMNYPDEIAEFEELYASADIENESITCPDGVCEVDEKEAVYGDSYGIRYGYNIYYDGEQITSNDEDDAIYDSEEECYHDAELDIDDQIDYWIGEGGWHEDDGDSRDNFWIDVFEVEVENDWE